MKIRVCLVATILTAAIVLYALYGKGDVKAALKVFGVEFSLEAKDRPEPKPVATNPKANLQLDSERRADSPLALPDQK